VLTGAVENPQVLLIQVAASWHGLVGCGHVAAVEQQVPLVGIQAPLQGLKFALHVSTHGVLLLGQVFDPFGTVQHGIRLPGVPVVMQFWPGVAQF
jgi:hypothetical protein